MDKKIENYKQYFGDINSNDLLKPGKCNQLAAAGQCNDLEVSTVCKTSCRASCLANDKTFNTPGLVRQTYSERIGFCMLRYL